MKFWLSKNSEIPIKEQLVAQVRIGVATGDLVPGEKLPSTRDLARRFSVNPNTISAAFQELASTGEVLNKQGSGVFISPAVQTKDRIDVLIDALISEAWELKLTSSQLLGRVSGRIGSAGSRGFTLVEPDPDLAEILRFEIRERTGANVSVITHSNISKAVGAGSYLIAMFDEEPKIAPLIDGDRCIYLKANSVAGAISGRTKPDSGELVLILSGWSDFQKFARLFLLAARVDPDSIVVGIPGDKAWRKAAKSASVIICDSLSATLLPKDDRVSVFQLIADSSMDQLVRAARNRMEPTHTL